MRLRITLNLHMRPFLTTSRQLISGHKYVYIYKSYDIHTLFCDMLADVSLGKVYYRMTDKYLQSLSEEVKAKVLKKENIWTNVKEQSA
uniref:Ovule protein n=1 Tax=Parascaris univalens TaxID=6257 RepID=A0A915BNW0_PARUN